MNVATIVYNFIKEKYDLTRCDSARLQKGIALYIQDNKMDEFENIKDKRIKKDIIKSFIQPLLDPYNPNLILYLCNYEDLSAFKLISNQIFQCAKDVYNDNKTEYNIDELEKKLINIVSKLNMDESIQKMIQEEFSECLVDIEFARKKSRNLSFRMSNLYI